MIRQKKMDKWERLINFNFINNILRPGTDQELFALQSVFVSAVLDKVLIIHTGCHWSENTKRTQGHYEIKLIKEAQALHNA